MRSFSLQTKKGTEVHVRPVPNREAKSVRFEVITGSKDVPPGTVDRKGFRCIFCDAKTSLDHVRAEGVARRLGLQLTTIVAEGERGKIYLPPNSDHESAAKIANVEGAPDTSLPEQALGFRVQLYGMVRHRDLFTPRQLLLLVTLTDLVRDVHSRVVQDVGRAKLPFDASEYATAICTYLALAVDRMADRHSSLARWDPNPSGYAPKIANTFGRQTLSMVWDFAEGNPFSDSSGNFADAVDWVCKVLDRVPAAPPGTSVQGDATDRPPGEGRYIVLSDPPYYDNIGYADLSDYFYVWLRRSLAPFYPQLFSTVLVPKAPELVAEPFRHGGREPARRFFEDRLGIAFRTMRSVQNEQFPLCLFYAFKQSETDDGDEDDTQAATASTGWETMLEGLLGAGLMVTGTWPMRSELANRPRANQSNALASSILLVCRPRSDNAPKATRREFLNALRAELPDALAKLRRGNIAPVDLAQALIGPGMAVFSRYTKVLESDGAAMTVRTALQLINQELDANLAAQDTDLDRETRFCLTWFEQHGFDDGPFGDADSLARAKNTAVQGLVSSGIVQSRGGKVRLLRRDEIPDQVEDKRGQRVTWLVAQSLVSICLPGSGKSHHQIWMKDALRMHPWARNG